MRFSDTTILDKGGKRMAIEILFNKFLLTQLINVKELKRFPYPSRNISTLAIPNRNGEIFQSAIFGSGNIEVTFNLIKEYRPTFDGSAVYDSEFMNYIRSLAFYLSTDEPAQLIISDEPNKFYYAICESVDLERTMRYGEGTIVFRCVDPFAYSLEEKIFEAVDGSVKIQNFGTVVAYPIFETTLKESITNLSVVSSQGVVQIGNPDKSNQQSQATNPDILVDTCSTVSDWYAGNSTMLSVGQTPNHYHIDSNLGLMSQDGCLVLNAEPTVEEIEEGTIHGYTGGFFLKNLDEPLDYWKTKMWYKFSSRQNINTESEAADQMGIIVLTCYDTNNKILSQFVMHDSNENYEYNVPSEYIGTTLGWQGTAQLKKPTNKRYTAQVAEEEELPKGANVIYRTEVTEYKLTVKTSTAPIKASASDSAKTIMTVPRGAILIEKRSVGSTKYFEVYLNEAKTTTGYIKNSYVTQEENGTIKTVTYELPSYPDSGCRWDDFWGSIAIEKKPYTKTGTGNVWVFTLLKQKWGLSQVIEKQVKTFNDPTGTKFTDNGKLAKIGIYMGTKENAPIIKSLGVHELRVTKYDQTKTSGVELIGNAGDTITIDCNSGEVLKNGEPFMEHVNVGSDFFGVPPMTESSVHIVTDDPNAETIAKLTERYI